MPWHAGHAQLGTPPILHSPRLMHLRPEALKQQKLSYSQSPSISPCALHSMSHSSATLVVDGIVVVLVVVDVVVEVVEVVVVVVVDVVDVP